MTKLSVRQMILISIFSALTAVGALISIPIDPVPISLQTLFTLLSGMILGSRLGAASQMIYLLLGAVGLPVFSGFRGGVGMLFGPTGGYLWGFVLSAYTVGFLVERKKIQKLTDLILAGFFGVLIIDFFGILQLYLVTQLNLKAVFLTGVLPFIPGDLIKIFAASLIANKLKQTLTLNRML